MFYSHCIFNGIRYDSYYVRFIAAIPFCGYVLLYDKKNVAVTGGIYFALNVFVNIIRIGVQHAYPKEVAIDHIYATFAIGLLIVLILQPRVLPSSLKGIQKAV